MFSAETHERLGKSGRCQANPACKHTSDDFERSIELVCQFRAGTTNQGVLGVWLKLEQNHFPNRKHPVRAMMISKPFHSFLSTLQLVFQKFSVLCSFLHHIQDLCIGCSRNRWKNSHIRFMSIQGLKWRATQCSVMICVKLKFSHWQPLRPFLRLVMDSTP